ncbi:DNA polymerase kappa-like [Glandiceps talaboti]
MLSRMALNTHKAGMEGIDKEKINKVIYEASKGSKFYENEQKKDKQVNKRVEQMKEQLAKITEQQIRKALIEVDKMVEELKNQRDFSRTIVHIDMDMFYAAVEMRDNPSLKDKPMAVGGTGMLSTSNYKARRFGVRAAMPGFIGKKLCPDLIIVPPSFDKYRAVSKEVREIFSEYDPNFVPMSLDEAYLDLTEHLEKRRDFPEEKRMFPYRIKDKRLGNCSETKKKARSDSSNDAAEDISPGRQLKQRLFQQSRKEPGKHVIDQNDMTVSDDGDTEDHHQRVEDYYSQNCEVFGTSAEEAVRELRFRIEQKTQLTASAGIASNTMLSKICSDRNKPNGQYRIEPTLEAVTEFIKDLPIRKVSGVGKVTEKLLNALDINTCTDLYKNRAVTYLLFSKISSNHFLRISLGMGSNRIERDGERKSMSTERTFREISDRTELYEKCFELSEALAEDLQSEKLKGRTITLKIKLVTFEVKTRAVTLPYTTNRAEDINSAAQDLLKTEIQAMQPESLRLRLMGVRMSSFVTQSLNTEKQGSIISFFQKPNTSTKSTETTTYGRVCENKDTSPVLIKQPIVAIVNDNNMQTCSNSKNPSSCLQNCLPTQELLSTQSEFIFGKPECEIVEASQYGISSSKNVHIEEKDAKKCKDGEPFKKGSFLDNFLAKNTCKDRTTTTHIPCDKSNERNQPLLVTCTSEKTKENCSKVSMSGINRLTQQQHISPGTCSTREIEVQARTSELPPADLSSLRGNETCVFTCPICSHQQCDGDLTSFNSHVDMCLNAPAIQDILENGDGCPDRKAPGSSPTRKRSLASSQHPLSKKRRKETSNMPRRNSTLDHFFLSSNSGVQ